MVLEEVVRHHVEEEENELFRKVREQDSEDLNVLGACLQKSYRELMKDEPARNLPRETRSAVVRF